jgi:hypothetical protein
MSLLEVLEPDASQEIAVIYGELRAATGLPIVNLIWRHLAALPGVLTSAWATVRPVIGSAVLVDGVEQLEMTALRDAGHATTLFPTITKEALAVIEIYNRGNCINLQVLTALRRALAGEAVGNRELLSAAQPLPRLVEVPPMPRMEALDSQARTIVLDLAALHDAARIGVVPSLYRHLALWPNLLPDLYAACARLMSEGVIQRGRQALLVESHAISARLLPSLRLSNDFPESQKPEALAALDTFTGSLIAEMTVVGLFLRAAARSANDSEVE